MLLNGNLIDSLLSEKLRHEIDWGKDFPEYIFSKHDYKFLFFERPIVCGGDLLEDLLSSSVKVYAGELFASFGNPNLTGYAQYLIGNIDLELKIKNLQEGFRDFYKGSVGYPLLISNVNLDWIVFESAREELGVIAIRSDNNLSEKFIANLDAETYISCEQMNDESPFFLHLLRIYGELIFILRKNYT